MLITDNLPTYEFKDWFSIDANFITMGVIDPNMVYRYYGTSIYSVSTLVEEIISETEWLTGDLNFDEITNILDIITLVNHILNSDPYNYFSDINEDSIINIQDVILILNVIMDT